MRTNDRRLAALGRTAAASTALLGLFAAAAGAQSTHEARLIAAPFVQQVALPDGGSVSVAMWGFALDADADGVADAPPSVPGPRLSVPPGTTTLVVHLTNRLPVPTSLVIPGQAFDAAPTRNAAGRIVSMTAETAPDATGTYTFGSLKTGTFLYQSGTHPAVQVQMGLYGALTFDAAAAVAGPPGTPAEAYAGLPYDHEVVLVFGEIDRALHEAVAAGSYGTAAGPTSTIDYAPSLFLINGRSYASELSPSAAGVAGARTLVRLLNAGLRTHAPVLENGTLALVAEDGNPYPFARPQASILLAAGKTHDALWTPSSAGLFTLYDRTLSLHSAGQAPGGMLARLAVGAGAAPADPVTAADDAFATPEDVPLAVAAAGVLGNDTGAASAELLTVPRAGGLALQPDGGFTYVPGPNFSGFDSFTYRAVNGTDVSAPATVVVTVSPVADAPLALAQAVGVQPPDELPITLTGRDPDGDPLTFYATDLP
ncbi:MAG TPA: Ig-like domain-containing protein, partial [Vicinamibacteria bacterium]